jgi:hypothetical protein
MAKTKVTVDLLGKYFKPLIRVAGQELAEKAISTGVRLIRGKTRSGNDMSNNQEIEKQPPLAPSTIRQREYLSRFNSTHGTFRPNRSNLTITGQLIDAVFGERIGTADDSLRLRWSVADTTRTPYKTGPKGIAKNTPDNKTLAEYQADKGRKFIGLDNKSRQQITNELTRVLRRKLKSLI